MNGLSTYRIANLLPEMIATLAREIQPQFVQFAPHGEDLSKVITMMTEGDDPHLIVARQNTKAVGFLIYQLFTFAQTRICDLHGVVVNEANRSSGVYSAMFSRMLQQSQSEYLLLLTQNPRVYEQLVNSAHYVLPDPKSRLLTANCVELLLIERRLQHSIGQAELPIVSGLYRHLRPVPNKSARNPAHGRFLSDSLEKYDAMLFLAKY